MTSFLLIDDPDPERRIRASQLALRHLGDRGLRTGSLERGTIIVHWGAPEVAPVATAVEPAHTTLLLGDAIPGPGAERVSAEAHGESVRSRVVPPSYDGFHLAVTIEDGARWSISADLLGIFPVYYTPAGEAVLVGSDPELLGAHEDFRETLDPLGLTGVLLTNGPVDGRTMLKGVRRLAAGHVLRRERGEAPVEVPHYAVHVSREHHDVPLAEWSHRLHEALVASCRRHVPPGVPHALLLSGGLDSRLLAGMLARLGNPVTAVTRGVTTDNDYRLARLVARHVGFAHRLFSIESGGWKQFQDSIRRHGMPISPGLGGSSEASALQGVHPRAVSGYVMDAIVGGTNIGWCFSPTEHTTGFDTFFQRGINGLAVPVEALQRILRRDVFGDSVQEVLRLVRARYEAMGDSHLERTWRYSLENRQRFWIASPIVRQTETAWPVVPHLDRDVFATAGGIPLGVLAERVVERDMVIRFYNDLASLPLDRNSADISPLDPGLRALLRNVPRRLAHKAAVALRLPPRERRYYYRTFDMDSPAWREVRSEVEARHDAAGALFERSALREFLPPPGGSWPPGNPLRLALGRRLLLGAVTWMDIRA